jgi:DinB superfamily
MGAQGESLATKLQLATDQLIAAVDSCSDAHWKAKTSAEGWSVGVAAHHAAGGIAPTSGMVQAVANGMPLPPITMEILDGGNAEHAKQFANCTRAETLDLARKNSAGAISMLRGLSDEQLGKTATLALMNNATVSAAQLAEMAVVGHVQGHLQSIKATA